MNEWNLAQIPEISAFFRIFRALFMRNSRHFIIFWEYPWNSDKIPSNFRRKMTKFIDQNRNEMKFHFIPAKKFDGFLLEFWGGSGAKAKRSCRARKMRKNKPTLAIVAVHTEENEPLKVWGVSFHYFNRILSTDPTNRIIVVFLNLSTWTKTVQKIHESIPEKSRKPSPIFCRMPIR